MRRNDEQFKAEIFRRFDDYKIKRKKRMMTAGSTALMLVLCAGLLQMPIDSFLSPDVEETMQETATTAGSSTIATTTTEATTTESVDSESGKLYEYFDFGKQDSLDGESTKEAAELWTANVQSVTVTYGTSAWNFDSSDDAAAVMEYVLNNQNTEITTGGATTAETVTDCANIIVVTTYLSGKEESTVTNFLTEPRWDFTALAAFLDELKEKDE